VGALDLFTALIVEQHDDDKSVSAALIYVVGNRIYLVARELSFCLGSRSVEQGDL
jgi:hypothetical protein